MVRSDLFKILRMSSLPARINIDPEKLERSILTRSKVADFELIGGI